MTQPRFEFQAEGEKVTFWLRVQPRARRERLMADPQGQLRLQVTAPPAAGRANEACVRYLARSLRLPASAIEIVTGHRSARKLLRITGRSARKTLEGLQALIG